LVYSAADLCAGKRSDWKNDRFTGKINGFAPTAKLKGCISAPDLCRLISRSFSDEGGANNP
jgi:hypothetical protein